MDQPKTLPTFMRYTAQRQVGQGAFGTVYLADKKELADYLNDRKKMREDKQKQQQQRDDSQEAVPPLTLSAPAGGEGEVTTATPQHRSETGTPAQPNSGNNSTGEMGTPIHSAGSPTTASPTVVADSQQQQQQQHSIIAKQQDDEKDYQEEPERVAIKVIANYNRSEDFARRVWQEITILHAAQVIPQVVPLYHIDVTESYVEEDPNTAVQSPTTNAAPAPGSTAAGAAVSSPNSNSQKRIAQYNLQLTMDYVPYDLANLIGRRAINTEAKIRSVICQLLLGINALHDRQIVHRDLSSRNVLVTNELSVYICDFGLARLYDPEEQMSYGVITQWYRAPEVLLDCKYGPPVDVWAVAVMMVELFLQAHLFMGRNKDVVHQLNCILGVCGFCNKEWLDDEKVFGTASANAKAYMKKQKIEKEPISTSNMQFRIPPSDPAIDLMNKVLDFNPATRWTARQALTQHEWFQGEPEIKKYIQEQLEYIDNSEQVPNPFQMIADEAGRPYNDRINAVLDVYAEE